MMTLIAQLEFNWAQALEPFTQRWWQETTCSMLVGIACGVLGCFVVLRRMALIGDALSHAVLPGVVVALMLTGSSGVAGLLAGALLAGLLTAVAINLVSRFSRTKEDSAIGIVFTALFAAGIILISGLPRGVHFDLKCFLFGDPLAVGSADLLLMAIICPLVLAVVAALYHPMKLVSFDPVVAAAMGVPVAMFHYLLMGMLSATVVAGLKTTGVILVVAMIITPASAAYQLSNRLWLMLALAGLFGAISAAAGMSLAFVTNSPSGPAMVIVATAIFSLCVLLSPHNGLVLDLLRKRRLRDHVEAEDVLKAAYHCTQQRPACTVGAVVDAVRMPLRRVQRVVRLLAQREQVNLNGDELTLTENGRKHAVEMVRSHRLWESYLADQANLPPDQVHEEAERLEHAHELADEVDRELGHPSLDPHGEEIPRG